MNLKGYKPNSFIKIDPYRLHLLRGAVFSFANILVWTAMTIYEVQVVGMTPLQLVLVGTVMEISLFLFEIPTGIVADLVSRRLSYILGVGIMGAAYLLQGSIAAFPAILIGHFIWGFGYTFTSGAYSAWLVDEIGQERAADAFTRGAQVDRAAALFGIIASIVLGAVALRLPLQSGGGILIGLVPFLLLTMPEEHFTPTPAPDRSTWQKMTDTFREGVRVVRRQPVLLNILGVGIFLGLFSEGWDRLWQAHLLNTFKLEEATPIPAIVWFGALNMLLMVVGILTTEAMRRRLDFNQPAAVSRWFFWLIVIMVGTLVLYGLALSLLFAVVVACLFIAARDLLGPLLEVWTNQHVESHVRATVLSMQSQVDAIGQTLGGPPIGLVANLSLRVGFLLSAAILLPAIVLLRRVQNDHKPPAEVAAGADLEDASAEIGVNV